MKQILSIILIVALVFCSANNVLAADEDGSNQSITFRTIYDLSMFKPIDAERNYPTVYIVRRLNNQNNLALMAEYPCNSYTGNLITININDIYNDLQENELYSRPAICIGWLMKGLRMTDMADQGMLQSKPNTYYTKLAINTQVAPDSQIDTYSIMDSTLLNMVGIGAILQGEHDVGEWRPMAFVTLLMQYCEKGISVIGETYTVTEGIDDDVKGGITSLISSVGPVLTWFWDRFGMYITLIVLSLACGAILWARGSASGGD